MVDVQLYDNKEEDSSAEFTFYPHGHGNHSTNRVIKEQCADLRPDLGHLSPIIVI